MPQNPSNRNARDPRYQRDEIYDQEVYTDPPGQNDYDPNDPYAEPSEDSEEIARRAREVDPRLKDPRNQPYNGGRRSPRTPIAKRPKEKAFEIDYHSEVDGEHYRGTFVARKPKLKDQHRIASAKADFLDNKYYDDENPGCGVPEHMDQLAEAMAYLDCLLIKFPRWWEGSGEVEDPGLIWVIFGEACALDPFRRFTKPADTDSAGEHDREAGDRKHHRSDPDRDVADLVDDSLSDPNN